jgi:APA family basic amino acid/polyamine antiporter
MPGPLFTIKPLQQLLAEAEQGEGRLRRVLGPVQLTSLGIGAVIGAGIFVSTGVIARQTTGPALMLSYVVAGLACLFAGLCYCEFAGMVPVAGSAYTYAYATLGELFAWVIGWDLTLEYAVSAATVANGWSGYFQNVLGIFGIALPASVNRPLVMAAPTGGLAPTGSTINLPALAIVLVVTAVLVVGIRESARFNSILVAIKVSAVLFVVAVGAFYVKTANWHPFAPFGFAGLNLFGHTIGGRTDAAGQPVGMLAGAALAFFAYIGFDSVATQTEEARRPQRDVPIAILGSLLICTVLYIAVVAVITGMVRYTELDLTAPVADAFRRVGLRWAQFVIALAGIAGITSVLLVTMLGQARILLAIARDGLLPAGFFAAVHPRFQTPWKSTLATGAFVGVLAAFLPIDVLLLLVNMGTLLAFVLVCGAVLVMRRTHPGAARPFRVPLVPLVPLLGIGSCGMLMFSLPAVNWIRLFVWLGIGLLVYFTYGRRHSHLTGRALVVAVAGALLALGAQAQELTLPPDGDNQKAVVAQWIGPVEVAITYHSPKVISPGGVDRRGKIWGTLVPYGYTSQGFGTCGDRCPWRGGANENTVFTTSHAVKIEGQPLAAGSYGLHFLPGTEEWTILFSKNSSSWGSFFYQQGEDALRVKVKPAAHAFSPWLAYEFPERAPDHATAQLAWEDLAVPFRIAVDDVDSLYLAAIREELRGPAGFHNDSWVEAARFCLLHKVNLEEGLSWARQAVSSPSFGREDFTTLTMLAAMLEATGKTVEAAHAREQALNHPTATAIVLHGYARGKLARGEKAGAIEVFLLNARRHPNQWPVHAGLMRAYSAQGKFKEALAEARLALAQAPDELNRRALAGMIETLKSGQDIN